MLERIRTAGADLHLGSDMFGRGALEISSHTMSGSGIRMSEGESMTEAMARQRRVFELLSIWGRN